MIMEWMRKEKGFISIFLCLLLLPMVTYSTMIIDASRLQMSRVQMQSAGDLAMNAALSEYEHKLEEMYGLFATATSKNDPNLKKGIERYFEECIQGKLADDGKNHYSKMLAEQLTERILNGNEEITEDDITNFIEMRLEDDFQYEPVDGSEVCNPRIMKGQIIDYMKYKGPVSLATNLLTKVGFLQDSSNQVTAINSKIEYAQALSDLEDPFKNAWNAIQEYDKAWNTYTNGNYGKEEVFKMVIEQEEYCDMMGLVAIYSNALKDMTEKTLLNVPDESSDIFYKTPNGKYYYYYYEELTAIENIKELQQGEEQSTIDFNKERMNKVIDEICNKIINFDKRIKEDSNQSYASFEAKYGMLQEPFRIVISPKNDGSGVLDANIDLCINTNTEMDAENMDSSNIGFPSKRNVQCWNTNFTPIGIEDVSKEKDISNDTQKIEKYYEFCRKLAPHYYQMREMKAFHDYYEELYNLYESYYNESKKYFYLCG